MKQDGKVEPFLMRKLAFIHLDSWYTIDVVVKFQHFLDSYSFSTQIREILIMLVTITAKIIELSALVKLAIVLIDELNLED